MQANIRQLETLDREYRAWISANGKRFVSADELLVEDWEHHTPAQRDWLENFIQRYSDVCWP